jgi:serine carboxypeptidase-like clade 2
LRYTKNPEGSYYLYPQLIDAGLKIMVYTGDQDAMVPITGTKKWITQLK